MCVCLCVYVQYSPTNLVREQKTSCSLYSTWQWPRASTHTYYRHLFGGNDNELVSRILERRVKTLEWKTNWSYMVALYSPLAMWRRRRRLFFFFCFLFSSSSSSSSLSRLLFLPSSFTYLAQLIITWFIITLVNE